MQRHRESQDHDRLVTLQTGLIVVRIPWARFANAALLPAAAASLLAILVLRLCAVSQFPSVHTPWDDGEFRMNASAADSAESALEATGRLLLPHGGLELNGRLNGGYTTWLVAALKVGRFLGLEQREFALQYGNAFMLVVGTAVVLLFAYWSFRDWALATAAGFFYAGAPIVFGISRWVLTENLVLLAGVTSSAFAAWLLGRREPIGPRDRLGRVVMAVTAAWGIGLCSTAREYASPSFVVLVFCTAVGLLAARRWLEAGALAVVTGAFLVPWAPAFVAATRVMLAKGGQGQYFHSLTEWIPHVSFYTVGLSLFVLLLGLGSVVIVQRSRLVLRHLADPTITPRQLIGAELSGVHLLFWGHLVLILIYGAGIIWSRNRVTRPAVMLMIVGLALVLIGIRSLPALRARLLTAPARLLALVLIVLSWGVLTYQLLFAFDGGRTYAHASYRLEYFNYPLRLRALKDASDSYTCGDVCLYDHR
jgi:hypothetical protein